MKEIRRAICLRSALGLLLACVCSDVVADEGFENDEPSTWVWPFPFILSGDETITNNTCVISSNGGNTQTGTYTIRITDLDSNGYELEQVSPNTSDRLPVQLIWSDATAGDFPLSDGVEVTTSFTGNLANNCTRTSSLRATILEFDYLSVEAGNYFDSYELRGVSSTSAAGGMGMGMGGSTEFFTTVNIDVTVPEFVRVSFPGGDIPITFSTTVDQLEVEQFCIYTNAADGDVGVAIGLQNTDVDGNHSVLDSGIDQIEYSFEFRTAGGGITLGTINTDSGMAEIATATADTGSDICAINGNTHEFAVFVTAAEMAAALVGNYSDLITVYVEPAL